MNQQLDALHSAGHHAAKTFQALQDALATCGPVESLIISPMIGQAVKLSGDIDALIVAIKSQPAPKVYQD